MSMEILKPSPGKKFANADETELYSAIILSPGDSIDNYHEVDELFSVIVDEWSVIENESEEEPVDLSELNLQPDENGRISYAEAQQIIFRMSMLTNRIIELTDKVNEISDAPSVVDDGISSEEFFNILLGVE